MLSAADVHVALRLAELVGEADEAVRAGRGAGRARHRGSGTCSSIWRTIRETATRRVRRAGRPLGAAWPEPDGWLRARRGERARRRRRGRSAAGRPLRLLGSRLYLDRYWREERRVAGDLRALAADADGVSEPAARRGLDRLFPGDADRRQRDAAAAAVRRRFAVVAGGPGTGKTTTVARIVALLGEQARPRARRRRWSRSPRRPARPPRGCRRRCTRRRPAGRRATTIRELLLGLRASTLHRLLGWRPGSHSRFRHDRGNRLPHDVVIVDETSMVSLSLMARLVEAVRPDARLDPGRRPGPARLGRGRRRARRHRRSAATGGGRRLGDRRARARPPLRRRRSPARRGDPPRRRATATVAALRRWPGEVDVDRRSTSRPTRPGCRARRCATRGGRGGRR